MGDKKIITIGRQYGSGGRYIGKILADKLGCPFYDKEILKISSEESGINEELFHNADEKITNRFWGTISIYAGGYGNRHSTLYDIPFNDKLFLIQSDIIRKIAEQESCVIVGRCADYILKNDPNTLKVFIHCPLEDRIERIVKYYNVEEKDAHNVINKTDKMRASYYNYNTDSKWGQADNYHLSIDSSVLGIEGTAELILKFAYSKSALTQFNL